MYFEELSEQCQECGYLRCSQPRMDGNNSYSCMKIPVFLKNKKADCDEYKSIPMCLHDDGQTD